MIQYGKRLVIAMATLGVMAHTHTMAGDIGLTVQDRAESGVLQTAVVELDPSKTALVMVDVWNGHSSTSFAARADQIVPHIDRAAKAARKLGMVVIHGPTIDGLHQNGKEVYPDEPVKHSFFADLPQREAVLALPQHPLPRLNQRWQNHAEMPYAAHSRVVDGTWVTRTSPKWRIHPGLVIEEQDYIIDSLQELWNVCRAHEIENLIYCGFASNMCLVSKPWGVGGGTSLGLNCYVLRDLISPIAPVDEDLKVKGERPWETARYVHNKVVHHIERHFAPTFASRQLLVAAGMDQAEEPGVQLEDLIKRTVEMRTGDAVEHELLETYMTGSRRTLYNLRSMAPWARSEADGSPYKPWPGAEPVDADYEHAPPDAVEGYRDLKFGVRVHFGVYQQLAEWDTGGTSWRLWPTHKEGEGTEFRMGEEEFADFARHYCTMYQDFNPVEFDADEWAQLFKRAGFKFAVLTTKHHDGFSMFHTRTRIPMMRGSEKDGQTEYETIMGHYSIEETPYGKDIVGQFAEALRREGLAVGLYFSNPDWMDYDARFAVGNLFRDPAYRRETEPQGWDRALARHREQLLELCTNYGTIDILSFDHGLPHEAWPDFKQTLKLMRQEQPSVMMRFRGIGNYGDFFTPEGYEPRQANVGKPWSVIGVSGAGASPTEIIHKLIRNVSIGGTFQWNCDPGRNGTFHPDLIERMHEVGDWLEVNGEAIYGTRPREISQEGDDIRFTCSKDKKYVYAISLQWPGERVVLQSVRPRAGSQIHMLGVKEPVEWRTEDEGLVIEIPRAWQAEKNRPCKHAYIFRIQRFAAEN